MTHSMPSVPDIIVLTIIVLTMLAIGYMVGTVNDLRQAEQTMYAPVAQRYAEQNLAYQRALDDAIRGYRQCLHDLDTARYINER